MLIFRTTSFVSDCCIWRCSPRHRAHTRRFARGRASAGEAQQKGTALKNENIILIGMSGAGKSTLGVLLAKALGMDFVDTDILIQQRAGRLLQEIIDQDGVEPFLKLEEAVVSSLDMQGSVIATGGSVVYSEKAMEAIKKSGRAVYLDVPFNELEARLGSITTRGIVMKKGENLRDVYNERLPLYQKYADLTIDCAGSDIEQCVSEIIKKLR